MNILSWSVASENEQQALLLIQAVQKLLVVLLVYLPYLTLHVSQCGHVQQSHMDAEIVYCAALILCIQKPAAM